MSYSFTITPSDVANVAPEFQGITQERIDFFIGIVEGFVSECFFGEKAKFAALFYLLHLLTQSGKAGISGSITSERVGELSRNYGSNASEEAGDMANSSYGMMCFQLRKGVVVTPLIVG